MSADVLATRFLVLSRIRAAAQEGVSITVIRKGDPQSGAILLKVNALDGSARLFSQIWLDETRVWMPCGSAMPDREADEKALEMAGFDPDVWLIEVEDRQGRLWFEGNVMEL